MIRLAFFLALFFSGFTNAQQGYKFNEDTSRVFYKEFTNTFVNIDGTPLCFDGTLRIHPTDILNQYYIEVLDTVSRDKGEIHLAKELIHPDGFKENVIIDKIVIRIEPLSETAIFLGKSKGSGAIDPEHLDLSVGIVEDAPKTNFKIKEFTIIANKELITVKSSKITPQAIEFIRSLNKGTQLQVAVVYSDPLKKTRRAQAFFTIP